MKKHYFHDVARSERYYTSTLLAHLLMSNDFEGVKLLFKYLFKDFENEDSDDFEIVTELDPLRDGSVSNKDIKQLYRDNGRVAVPDVFIRWGTKVIVIEAKFFTHPNDEDLEKQVLEQKRALELIIKKTNYNVKDIEYCLLTIRRTDNTLIQNIHWITWDDIIRLFNTNYSKNHPKNIAYTIDIINNAIERAKKETEKTDVKYSHINTIDELVAKLPELIKNGEVWVGFSEKEPLEDISLEYLEKRSHYRVSKKPYSKNWIRIDELVRRYISVKHNI